VNYIVEGSGQKYGNTFRLRVQLIMAAEERHLWAESYEDEINDANEFFNIQSHIAQSIASELKAAITPEEKQLIEKIPTSDLTAYDAYLQGQFYWKKLTKIDLETSMMYFEKAKEIDPEYALAYAGICDVWMGLQQMGTVRTSEAGPKIEEAIMKALELDSNRAEVQYTLANMKSWTMWDWKAGESAFNKAIAINPNHAGAHAYYSHLLNVLGRPEEAMKQIEIALKLDPVNSLIKAMYGIDLLFVRRYDDAVKAFQESIDIDPTQPVAGNMIRALHFAGREDEALEIWRKRLKDPEQLKAMNEGYAEGGFRGAHKKLADLGAEQSKTTDIRPYVVAHHYVMAGDIDNAIFWLEKTYEDHDPNLPYLSEPIYDFLRDDPRFQDLCRRMNLPYKQN
jgi:tetratricopeptide (TPR) repeat protein